MVQSRPRGLPWGSTLAMDKSLHGDLWPHWFFMALVWPRHCSSSFLFLPMETWEQGKKAGLTSASPATGVGRQPGQASGLGTWQQFQVLSFRHHNRSVMCLEHRRHTNSAGTHPGYPSICTGKQPEAEQPQSRQRQ